MSPIRILVVLIALASLCAAHNFEGVYSFDGLGGRSKQAYICREGDYYYGNLNWITAFRAQVQSGPVAAKGRFYGGGYKFGGPRRGVNNWAKTTGKVWIYEKNMTTLVISMQYKKSSTWHNYTSVYLGSNSDPSLVHLGRDVNCFIYDRNSPDKMTGLYYHSGVGSVLTGSICVKQGVLNGLVNIQGVYNRTYYGKCVENGQICAADFYSKNEGGSGNYSFGSALMIRSVNGSVLALEDMGHTYFYSTPRGIAVNSLDLQSSTPGACEDPASLFKPVQCSSFDNDRCQQLNDFAGLCEVNTTRQNSEGNNCFRAPFSKED